MKDKSYEINNKTSFPGRFVFLVSPYSHKEKWGRAVYEAYLDAALFDSLCIRKEKTYAPHGYITRALDDTDLEQRDLGTAIGIAFAEFLNPPHAVYANFGISFGMKNEIDLSDIRRRQIVYRELPNSWLGEQIKRWLAHPDKNINGTYEKIRLISETLKNCNHRIDTLVRLLQQTR